ncbi:MAG: hypothetical protein DPW18_13920 [Chloroflexi bacterium]|nr:hypothetical protein [Chloroflexota bacterium]
MDFLEQKMEYIHQNPIAKDWKLVDDRAVYPFSSACYYDLGRTSIVEVTDIREWLAAPPPPRTAEGA